MSATIKRVADFNLENLGVCEEGREIMSAKAVLFFFEISNLEWHTLEIIKQEALSVGGDFATPRGAIKRVGERKGVLVATRSQLCRIVEKLALQPFGLKALAEHLRTHLDGELHLLESCADSSATHAAESPTSRHCEPSVRTAWQSPCESPTSRHCEARAQRATKQSHYLESPLILKEIASPFAPQKTRNDDSKSIHTSCVESLTHRHCEARSLASNEAISPFGIVKEIASPFAPQKTRNDDSGSIDKNCADSYRAPQVMAIVNVESDSFYEEFSVKSAIDAVRDMLEAGVAFIDIGAASSAPGKPRVESATEISRLKHLCEQIKREKLYEKARFSIDSYNLETARFALEHGFSVVNDVSGLAEIKLAEMARDYGADYVLMATHAGWLDAKTATNAQNLADKNADIILELDKFFSQKIAQLESKGVKKIIIDPGFGFAKTHAQNLEIVKNLAHFKRFKRPILMGLSNKKSTEAIAKNRAVSTLVLNTIAAQNGASILRVHDWAAHLAALKTLTAIK